MRRFPIVALALCALATGVVARAAESLAPWTTEDILDQRIDEEAQYSLMRMFSRSLLSAVEASAMLSAIKAAQLAGIYQVDRKVPALRAREELGGNWWEVIPAGVDAICWKEPAGRPPMIVYRKSLPSDPARLDTALSAAWNNCGLRGAPPRPYVVTITKPPPPPPPPDPELPALPPSGLAVVVTTGGKPVAGADVGIADAAGGTAAGRTDAGGVTHFEPQPGLAELWVNGPPDAGGSPRYEPFVTLIDIEGGKSQVVHVELDAMKSPPEPPPPTCDENKWHEAFNACGRGLIGDAIECLKPAYLGYAKCAAKDGVKGKPPSPVCAAQVLAKFWKCRDKLDHKQRAKECHDKANAESGCDFPMVGPN